MRVYHLLPRKWALCDLKHRCLKVATFADLNDPFELRGVRLENRADRRRFNRWRKFTAAKLGLLCFSKSWRNPVLWSHYADEHKGFCLGFDVPASCLHEVKYVPERLQFEQLVPDEGQLQQLLRTKFKDWGYEGECRRIVRLHNACEADNLHFWPFGSDLELREVVLGDAVRGAEGTSRRAARRRVQPHRAHSGPPRISDVQRGYGSARAETNALRGCATSPAPCTPFSVLGRFEYARWAPPSVQAATGVMV